MIENYVNCCVISLVLCGVLLAMLAMFFNYSLKLKDKSLQLEKNDKEQATKHNQNCRRIEELEKKNGNEQRQINELKEQVKNLEEKLSKYE